MKEKPVFITTAFAMNLAAAGLFLAISLTRTRLRPISENTTITIEKENAKEYMPKSDTPKYLAT